MIELSSRVRDLKTKVSEQRLIMNEIFILKVLNVLDSSFDIYKTILNDTTRKKNKFSDLNVILKNLADEELRMRNQKNVVNFAARESRDQKKDENKKTRKDKKKDNQKKCSNCNRYHESDDCSAKNLKCRNCHKVEH